ncbi:hypothetical protein C8A03DRAFT_15873, partial [Achaetomium macrosporum]
AQLVSTDYDPAYDTLRFDILAILSTISLDARLCPGCRQTFLQAARHAFNTILDDPHVDMSLTTSPSIIVRAWLEPETGLINFITTANPSLVSVSDASLVRHSLNPDRSEEMLDRVFKALLVPGEEDTFNIVQAQLWLCLEGTYTVADAVRGQSLGQFARSHMQLLNALARAQGGAVNPRPRGGGGVSDDEENPPICTKCLGFQQDVTLDRIMKGYPWGGDVTLQTQAVSRWILHHMDSKAVAKIVYEQLYMFRSEWPRELVPEGPELVPDWCAVLDGVEKLPAFKARLRYLGRSEEYRGLQRGLEESVKEWKEGADARAAALASVLPTDVDLARRVRGEVGQLEEVANTKSMLQALVGELMASSVGNLMTLEQFMDGF